MGSVADISVIIAATLLLTITVFTGTLILQEVDAATNSTELDQKALDQGQTAMTVFDLGIVSVNVFFYLVAFIFAYRIKSSPVYALPAMIVLAVNSFVSMEIANVYAAFSRVGPFTQVANLFPATNILYSYYGEITMVLGAVLILFLYGKTSRGVETTV